MLDLVANRGAGDPHIRNHSGVPLVSPDSAALAGWAAWGGRSGPIGGDDATGKSILVHEMIIQEFRMILRSSEPITLYL